MRSILKRFLCGVISAAMLFTSAAIPVFADSETTAPSDYLVNITFDETGTGTGSFTASTGGTVTENGTVSYADNYDGSSKALKISTNAAGNYLTLPDGILYGKEAATFSFWIKPESGWPFMTSPNISEQTYLYETYLGMLATSSAFTAERYNNSGTRLSSVSANGSYTSWKYVTVVFGASGTSLYVNGELEASDTAAVTISDLFTSDAKTWIGHGNWGTGEGFSGMMDDFRIYGRALTQDEISALAADSVEYDNQRKALDYEQFILETHFYDADDTEIYQITDETSVTVKTTVKNYDFGTADVSFKVNDGTAQTQTLAQAAEYTFTETVSNPTTDLSVTVTNGDTSYDAGTLPKPTTAVVFPSAAPADSNDTTYGAHDPTVFKDPESGKYYVYSSHNLVFESSDLINWTKHDYTSTVTVPESAKTFIEENISNYGSVNTTYWAPDIYYKADDDYPYWFYLSTSCGLGGENSVISLVKAKSPGLWDGETEDGGVVFASKNGHNTNSIDANIYVEGDNAYFIWGSFWKGIYAAQLDTDTGKVENVDYTSGTTTLSTCNTVGKRMFSTPAGVCGPEGAYTVHNDDTGYTYMFTSYGWLGTNYNIRVARTNKTFADVLSDTNPHKQLLDYKDRPVGATYSDQVKEGGTLTELWGYKISGSYRLGEDGQEYLGSGHNSVFQDDDGQWYLVQHCRKVADATAYLQVKKMFWTEDGWPIISPMVYAGETEQEIPKTMVTGTWNLASVGHTIFEDGVTSVSNSGAYKGTDLTVESAEIVLSSDGKVNNGAGTWTYDNDHTVTITFNKDGDETKNEYFKKGDVMTLLVLASFDKDKQKTTLAMTGIDENGVTQFADKDNESEAYTETTVETTDTVIEKSTGGNPISGADRYMGDPAALVDGDTVYLYGGHDVSTNDSYNIPEWICYSSKNMTDWTYEGVVMSASDISWANDKTSAWASQAVKYGGKYYLYYCTWDKTASKYQSIGVAVSDSPTGPFEDIGEHLVNGYTMTTLNSSSYNDIDPTVWIETVDGVEHRYLAWGNNVFYVCELNEDMTSIKDISGDGQITSDDIKEQTINGLDGTNFTEAPWIYRRTDSDGNYTGKYYLFGAFDWREQMGYATSDSMYGPWEYQGVIMQPTATSNTNHPSVIDFNGKTYFIYHNGMLSNGSGFRRSVCVQEIEFDDDGKVVLEPELSIGLSGIPVTITQGENVVYHSEFTNPSSDSDYPISKTISAGTEDTDYNGKWEIKPGKADTENESYVSIQSVDKPGLYISVNSEGNVVLTQDSDGNQANAMTFKTVKALNGGNGVSFESVKSPGKFLTVYNGELILSKGSMADACSFTVTGPTITVTEGNDGTGTVSVLNAPVNAVCIAVKYDNNGVLSNVAVADVDGETLTFVPDKVFLWNTSMQPLDLWIAE